MDDLYVFKTRTLADTVQQRSDDIALVARKVLHVDYRLVFEQH